MRLLWGEWMEMAPAFQVTEVERTEMLDPELVYVDVNRCKQYHQRHKELQQTDQTDKQTI